MHVGILDADSAWKALWESYDGGQRSGAPGVEESGELTCKGEGTAGKSF